MRILVLLLAIANIAFFMWEYKSGAVDVASIEDDNSQDVEKILLITELSQPIHKLANNNTDTGASTVIKATNTDIVADTKTLKTPIIAPVINNAPKEIISNNLAKEKAPEKNTKANPPIAKSEPAHCYEIGPFSHKSYSAWLAQNSDIKKTVHSVNKNKQTPVSYLVYYPVNAGIKMDLATEFLKSHGIGDFYRLRDGEYSGNLSLGVFKNEDNAIGLQRSLLTKGVHAQLVSLYKTEPQLFALVKANSQQVDSFNKFKRNNPELIIKSNAKACQ